MARTLGSRDVMREFPIYLRYLSRLVCMRGEKMGAWCCYIEDFKPGPVDTIQNHQDDQEPPGMRRRKESGVASIGR